MTLKPERDGDPSAEEIRDDPEELVEQKQKRNRNAALAELIKMQHDEHPQRAVGDREAPIGSRHQALAANAVHGEGDPLRSGGVVAGSHLSREFYHSIDVAPFVVVPGEDLHLGSIDDHRG